MNRCTERLYNGLIKENPTFVLMLGMCPTLAVTTSAINGVGMGLSTTVVLVLSNMLISMLRKIIPDSVRMPAFIVVVASFVTIVQFLLEGFVPSLYDALGLYIPLIVVNCIILGRAESYASKNPVLPSIFDGIGMGLGFTVGLTCIGVVRPDKPITRALMEGKTPEEAKRELKARYFVPEERAALALETGAVGYQALKRLEKRDMFRLQSLFLRRVHSLYWQDL